MKKFNQGGVCWLFAPANAFLFFLLAIFTHSLFAQDSLQDLKSADELQIALDIANMQLQGDEQFKALENLVSEVKKITKNQPESADMLVMSGLINANFAGAKGGIAALRYAKVARDDLEKSITIDPNSKNGAAYIVLGSLYDQVPGWPISFGNKKKAANYYRLSIENNPNDVDSNFFYAKYLLAKKEYIAAKEYLLKAKTAPARANRAIADKWLNEQIEIALSDIDKELAK